MIRPPPGSTPLSLHDALPISAGLDQGEYHGVIVVSAEGAVGSPARVPVDLVVAPSDRKSTRLNSSHRCISYAVFCLKKKKKDKLKSIDNQTNRQIIKTNNRVH